MIGSHLHSFLLSQVFGLYFVIISVIFLSRASYYKNLMAKAKGPGIDVMINGLLFLLISLFFVVMHNIWTLHPRVAVTVVCWFFFIRSVLWLSAPTRMFNFVKKIWAGNAHRYMFTLLFLFGIYFMTRGFYLFMKEAGTTPLWIFTSS